MCRMLGLVGSRASAIQLATRFQDEARVGRVLPAMTPGHADGWGITYTDARAGLHHAGRSTRNAIEDPAYVEAIARLAAASDPTVMIAHVRKRTKGQKLVEHTHPFIRNGLALAHNGTVHGIAAPEASDSAALLSRIDAERQKGSSVAEAIQNLARDVDRSLTYSSLTLLVTDGRTLWGLRKIGNDPVFCAPDQCAPDYYTLGVAHLPDGSVVVSQEHELFGFADWAPLADGELVTVAPGGAVSKERVL